MAQRRLGPPSLLGPHLVPLVPHGTGALLPHSARPVNEDVNNDELVNTDMLLVDIPR